VWGSSSKKRPNAVTILRMFDKKILDMVQLLLLPANGGNPESARLPLGVDMKPMILFAGSVWGDTSASEVAQTYALVKSLFLDIFSGEEVSSIQVEGLQYLLVIAAGDSAADNQYPRVHLRWYKIRTKKSGQKLPRVELDELRPRFDFSVGRRKDADSGVLKEAMKRGQRPDEDFRSKQKNVGMDTMGDKVGRVHLSRQDLGQLQLRKMKGLKRNAALSDEDEEEQQEGIDHEMELDEAPGNEITKKPRIS
jgi:ribosome production factor 2